MSNIGLNIVETDGLATPGIQPAQTSVAAFMILSERGVPGEVCQVVNWSQFREHFGSYKAGANGAYAVQGFFDNGGAMAYVTRLITKAKANMGSYGSVTSSKKFPIALPGNNPQLELKVDDLTLKTSFVQTPAIIKAKIDATYKFEADTNLILEINGAPSKEYKYNATDFPNGPEKATPDEIAAVMNKAFPGVTATVSVMNNESFFTLQTVLPGPKASLKASGKLADALKFPKDAVYGTGNITNIKAATPQEVADAVNETLRTASAKAVAVVSKDQIVISHTWVGKNHTIQVTENETATAFGFDLMVHEGEDPDGALAASVALSGTFTVKAGYMGKEDPGAWGNRLSVIIRENPEFNEANNKKYDLLVNYDKNTVETWEALADAAAAALKLNNASSGSKYIMIGEGASGDLTPSSIVDKKPVPTPLENGLDDNLTRDNLGGQFTDQNIAVQNRFDTFDVQLVCCPESSEQTVVQNLLTYCENRGDCMFVGHTPEGAVSSKEAKDYGKQFRQERRVYGALYFPWIRIYDPLDKEGQQPKYIPPTGHIMGVYARTERERGIWKAPAGSSAVINGALDVRTPITDIEHSDLVKNGSVNAVRFISGQGIMIDSSRTLSTNTLWVYVNARLLFNYVKSSLKSGLRWVVQEPNSEDLWNKIKYNSVTPFLMGLWRHGAFGPGSPEKVFAVKVDAENNPPANIQQGILTVEVYFYPSRPAETVIITVGQQEGGATAGEK